MTPILLGAGIVVSNALVFVGAGKYAASLCRATRRTYDKNLRKPIDKRYNKTRPNPMIFKRIAYNKYDFELPSNTTENSLIFKLNNFSFFEAEKLTEELETHEKKETPSKQPREYYKIIIATTNENIKVGEIDFANWSERANFKIRIIDTTDSDKNNHQALDPDLDRAKYKKVLRNLKKYAKTTSAKLPPDLPAKLAISEASGDSPSGIFGLRDFLSSKVAKLPILGKYLGDKTRRMVTDTEAIENPFIKEATYIDALIKTASEKAAEENPDYSILENYFAVRKEPLQNNLYTAKTNMISHQNEIIARRAENKAKRQKTPNKTIAHLKTAGTIVIAVITFIGTIGFGLAIASTYLPFLTPAASAFAALGAFFGITIGAAWSVIAEIFGLVISKGISLVLGTTFITVGLGILARAIYRKALPDYKKQHLTLAEKDLKEDKKLEEKTNNNIEKLNKEEFGAIKTLETIREFIGNPTPNKSLDLSDKTLNHKIGNTGLAILYHHITNTNIEFPCEKLILTNSAINATNVALLTEVLKISQTTAGQAKIHQIDIRENYITKKGVEAIKDVLRINCTLTDLKYDQENLNPLTVKDIEKELLINRCLQEIPLELEQEKITKIFPEGIEAEAKRKMRRNFNLIDFPSSKKPNILTSMGLTMKHVADQNKIFVRLSGKTPTAKDYVDAFKIDQERCQIFTTDKLPRNMAPSQRALILQSIVTNPAELLLNLNPEQCKDLLKSLQPKITDASTKIATIEEILKYLPKAKRTPAVLTEAGKIIGDILKNNQAETEFIKTFDFTKEEITKKSEIDHDDRVTILTAMNSAHHSLESPGLSEIDLKKHQLELLVQQHSSDLQRTFKNFVDLYKIIPKDKISLVLADIDKNKFIKLVRADIYNAKKTAYTQLRRSDLREKHRRALLKLAFEISDDKDYEDKALVVSNILSNEDNARYFLDNPNTSKFREKYLLYAIKWQRRIGNLWGIFGGTRILSLTRMKNKLERMRKKSLATRDKDGIKILDRPLQTFIQTKLLELLEKEGSTKLKTALETNYDLRQFDFSKVTIDLDADLETHIKNIIKRNQLIDILENPPRTKTNLPKSLERFLQIYKKIDLTYFKTPAIDQNKLMALIKVDLVREKMLEGLKENIDEQHRRTLLAYCFDGEEDHTKKSALISKIISLGEDLNSERSNTPNTLEILVTKSFRDKKPYSYTKLLTELEKQRKLLKENKNHEQEAKTEQILQAELQEKLKNDDKYPCLRSSSLNGFDYLKAHLNENYILRNINKFLTKIHPDVRKFMQNICTRNNLIAIIHDFGTTNKSEVLEAFITSLVAIQNLEDRTQILAAITKSNGNKLLELVKHDIHDNRPRYKALKSLTEIEDQRVQLLAMCRETYYNSQDMTERPHCHVVATIVSKLIDFEPHLPSKYIWQMFDWANITRWKFSEYITELKILRNSKKFAEDKTKIEELIQAGIREDILHRIKCFDLDSDSLKQELNSNYDLVDMKGFDFDKTPIDENTQKHIRHICRRNLIRTELNDLRHQRASEDKINAAIQAELQEEITYKLKTIRSTKTPPAWLEKELEGSFDLTDTEGFYFETQPFPLETQKYIEYICQRNKLKKEIEKRGGSFGKIIRLYSDSTIPAKKCRKVFESVSKDKLLNYIQADLGTENNVKLEKLTQLTHDPKRITLLEHCFLVDRKEKDPHKKAILISGLLNLLPELKQQKDNADCQYIIKHMIHWALSTKSSSRQGLPHYHLKDILRGSYYMDRPLASIIANMDENSPLRDKLQEVLDSIEPNSNVEPQSIVPATIESSTKDGLSNKEITLNYETET